MAEFGIERLRSDVAELIGEPTEEIGDRDDLIDLGLDSIRLMHLVERWRTAGVEADFVELIENPTLVEWERVLGGG